jgi:hypothetical protein
MNGVRSSNGIDGGGCGSEDKTEPEKESQSLLVVFMSDCLGYSDRLISII